MKGRTGKKQKEEQKHRDRGVKRRGATRRRQRIVGAAGEAIPVMVAC